MRAGGLQRWLLIGSLAVGLWTAYLVTDLTDALNEVPPASVTLKAPMRHPDGRERIVELTLAQPRGMDDRKFAAMLREKMQAQLDEAMREGFR